MNTIHSQKIQDKSCQIVREEKIIDERYSAYLHDESKLTANGLKAIAIPSSEEELVSAIKEFSKNKFSIAASRTGLSAGSVPIDADHLISLDKIKGISEPVQSADGFTIRVAAGVTLEELNSYLYDNHYELFFPVDPTEWTASIGGMFATNASGSRSYYYGSIRNWVVAARIVLASGDVLEIERGKCKVEGSEIAIVIDEYEKTLEVADIPKPKTKNTLGYEFYEGMDLVDLFIGSEGTLGVVSELELRLTKRPEMRLYNLQFFKNEKQIFSYVNALRANKDLEIFAIESFDLPAFQLIKSSPIANNNRCSLAIKDDYQGAIYIEVNLKSEEDLIIVYEKLEEILEAVGASSEDSIAGFEDKDSREMKAFRHAVPERINSIIASRKQNCPGLHKIATDMAVEDKDLEHIYNFYKSNLEAAGLEYSIFGHIGNNHFHVNMMPRDVEELKKAKELYVSFAKEVVRLGGAVSAEHGIGRIKRDFLKLQYGDEVLGEMKKIKDFFDPEGVLSPGVLF